MTHNDLIRMRTDYNNDQLNLKCFITFKLFTLRLNMVNILIKYILGK